MTGRIGTATLRSVVIAAVMALLALVSGCGGDTSDTHGGNIVPPATGSPESTWDYMSLALNDQRPGGWINALADSFEYVPDPVSDAKYPGVLSSWGRAEEATFVQAAMAAHLEIAAELNALEVSCPSGEGSSLTWPSVEYSVVVAGADGVSPVTYRGIANLEFVLQGNFWYLSRWVDVSGAQAPWNPAIVCPTLGELRAVYRGK